MAANLDAQVRPEFEMVWDRRVKGAATGTFGTIAATVSHSDQGPIATRIQ